MPKQRPRAEVFLNLPYDSRFQNLYVAYIGAVRAFGMEPRVTLEIGGGARRLDRIFNLIQGCEFSVHDMSRVEMEQTKPRTPRFNMPFELGLAVAWEKLHPGRHLWFVMEALNNRLAKSLSDLNGTDAYIHGGTIEGIFREIGNAFLRPRKQPSVQQMWKIYREAKAEIPSILNRCGTDSLFQARVFHEISVAASAAAIRLAG